MLKVEYQKVFEQAMKYCFYSVLDFDYFTLVWYNFLLRIMTKK